MTRKFFRRLSAPYRGNQRNAPWYLRPFQALLAHPVYFSINRRSITGAVALGLFVCVFPFIGHTPVVVVAALLLRVNLPVAVLATWVANPLTYGPIFYGEYIKQKCKNILRLLIFFTSCSHNNNKCADFAVREGKNFNM